MHRKQRRMQIRQKQKRRRKNVSLQELSVEEKKRVVQKESQEIAYDKHIYGYCRTEKRSQTDVEKIHSIKFDSLLQKLRLRFPTQKIKILDEGSGVDILKQELCKNFGEGISVTTTDIRQGEGWPDKKTNVLNLLNEFGKNHFHLVVSTYGGATYTGLPEKAFFQIASVLKPGGIGVITIYIPKKRLYQLAKKLNCTIKSIRYIGEFPAESVVFTKNIGRKK